MSEGRVQQKARTRRDLLDAARRLMDSGEALSVNAVADQAGISRATAYRYFPDPDALMLEAALTRNVLSPEEIVGDEQDVRERVHMVRRYLFQSVQDAEVFYRRYLARLLESSVTAHKPKQDRARRRLAMLEHALSPVRQALSPAAFRDLLLSLTAASGMESYIALKDACGADDATASRISAQIIDAILDRALPQSASGRAEAARTSSAA
jgi:AcrR family transcriptional regulator